MNCPRCGKGMREMFQQGVMLDFCPNCKGLWMDGGEINYFVQDPEMVSAKLKEPLIGQELSELKCPRCQKHMVKGGLIDASLEVDHCESCDGLWFDPGELAQLSKLSGKRKIPDEKQMEQGARRGEGFGETSAGSSGIGAGAVSAGSAVGAKLMSLPSLGLRSVMVLSLLYGLVFVFFVLMVEFMQAPIMLAFLFVLIFAIIQFLISPWMMDLSLRWLQGMRWAKPEELPKSLNNFILHQVNQHKISYPRMGIIEDGNPNAFTYGISPGTARIVLTRGLLDMLDEDELKAVVAHELGHALHWDMAIMTAAMLVPEVLYIIYRLGIRIATSKGKRSKNDPRGYFFIVALVAFLFYIISQYIVLFLSRTREYYADRFSGEATQNPNALARGLVKVAYGLARNEQTHPVEEAEQQRPITAAAGAVQAFGIFNPGAARALASVTLAGGGENFSEYNLLGAMQWDLWNPWASWYELNSTHPLPAKRLQALGNLALAMGQRPLVYFDLQKPESYWDEFLVDILVYLAPLIFPLGLGILAGSAGIMSGEFPNYIWGILVFGLGLGFLVRVLFSYKGKNFPEFHVSGLLRNVKVSAVRPVPCTLKGKIIGRGIPGLIWSEDLVLQDGSGFIFLDYSQPFRILEWLFGLVRTPGIIGRDVEVKGWYRRCPMPFVEMKELIVNGKRHTCYVYHIKLILSIVMIVVGIFLTLSGLGG